MGRSDPTAPSQMARRGPGLQPAEMCGARVTKNGVQRGGTCKQKKGWGTDHPGYGQCKTHGGLTQAGKTAAAREMAREQIKREQPKRFGGQKIPNVVADQVLLEEVARSAAMVRFLEERISEWAVDTGSKNLGGLPSLVDIHYGGSGVSTSETEKRAWLYEYRQERKHLVMVTTAAINSKISERLVNIAQDQGRLFTAMLRAVFEQIDLTPDQARRAIAATPTVLRSAASGQLVRGELA